MTLHSPAQQPYAAPAGEPAQPRLTDSTALAAVDALLTVLPTPTLLAAQPGSAAAALSRADGAVVAAFVGATSADLAVVLADPASLDAAAGDDGGMVSRDDIVRPALERAAGVLGLGVLGDARVDDASALLLDPETVVFDLVGDGETVGWFAIRLRRNGSPAARSDSAVGNLGRINSVEMALTVEIGRTRMTVRDVLALEPGAVVELDRSVGSPADILLNGRLIAHGEIVVVDQDYAVRITEILDVAESLS
ncbi:flagellar motor switch protein FliN [Cryobacterium soli]|uniref:flagellar motor switch protein FliN n=1 Tax=Cryobacterium soli TaxID=2220095 RepID=UPI000E76228E|nr:flagellar motor switch protein FliN [Cryobacterium soli]